MFSRVWLVAMFGCTSPVLGTESPELVTPARPAATPQSWRPLANPAPFGAGIAQMMTDGTVLVQEANTENWWRLTPDEMGSYQGGTWSMAAALPAGYSPLYYASATLPDGRLIIEGGEYIAGDFAFSARGAIYDPIADHWTEVAPPADWTEIADASSMVLANGKFLLAACCTTALALLDESSLTWTPFGNDKHDINDEESWALLYDGTMLTVDTNNMTDLKASEIFDPSSGFWLLAGDTVQHPTAPARTRSAPRCCAPMARWSRSAARRTTASTIKRPRPGRSCPTRRWASLPPTVPVRCCRTATS
jgi:hypothetical protein